ncbi:MAG TPA: efflux RND transporter periplasmic adaptor subunit [Phycisphaerae bacterium]|nr:efflux RND transporter periplasmic adaptor subunit [Phycisphaerae bacterium]HNU43761.1 efflux RND transporter periplasmic adaptor subunit [Phycisphaerae bacterium]
MAAVIGVGVLGSAVWASVRWWPARQAAAAVATAAVEARDFAVVLKEKGELKAARSTDIKCEVEGRSTIISLIPEGSAVEKGDLLVELASDEIEDRIRSDEIKDAVAASAYERAVAELDIQRDRNASDIRKGRLEIDLKRNERDKYLEGDYLQRLKDLRVAIEQAEILLERRTEDFEASKQLRDREFITKTEYDEAEFNQKKAAWELDKARLALEVFEKYTHKAELAQKQSDLEEAEKELERIIKNAKAVEDQKVSDLGSKQKERDLTADQLAKFRAQKEKSKIYAPTQGFVVYGAGSSGGRGRFISFDGSGQIKEGATVYERQVLMQLPDTSRMIAEIRIHEAKRHQVKVGQPAMLSIEGVPGRQFTGKVTKIAEVADSQDRWLNPDLKEYTTEIELDSTDVALKPGVTAHVEIFVEQVRGRLAVPVQAVFSKSGRHYVFAQRPGEPQPVEVVLGSTGTEWVEVTSGLDAGTRVLLAVSEEHQRLLPDLPPVAPEMPDFPVDEAGMRSAGGMPEGQPVQRIRMEGVAPGGGPGGDGPGQGGGERRGPRRGVRREGGEGAPPGGNAQDVRRMPAPAGGQEAGPGTGGAEGTESRGSGPSDASPPQPPAPQTQKPEDAPTP